MKTSDDARRQSIEAALSQALGRSVRVQTQAALKGGDISEAIVVESDAGRFFAKTNDTTDCAIFTSEAFSLRKLREHASTRDHASADLIVPEVIHAEDATESSPGLLITEYLAPGSQSKTYDEELGRGLAAMHRVSANQFGFDIDTYCGLTRQPNAWTTPWLDFYITHRLQHQVALAYDKALFDGRARIAFDQLFAVLDDRLASDPEPPSLIHGDLWAGNVLTTQDGRPALIDPASSFSHREAELGMMLLFGGFSERTLSAYKEAYPLSPGWKQRNPLYQLYHVLNHANLFGGRYVTEAMSIVRRFL
ncbi:MAG: fructosamine kinase family protein [Deltaproteobacteria bacterium]|nr:fructosamine kinase family protein [Deltaproteobacteria bacterium]